MNAPLPDISMTDLPTRPNPLSWVGMQGIDLPVTIAEADGWHDAHARVDIQVDLPNPHVKGIHMSRLYQLLAPLGEGEAITPEGLRSRLQAMIDSHQDCGTRAARLRMKLSLLVQRPALITPDVLGWKAYPVRLDAQLIEDKYSCRVQATIGYSSTCPCSAALARRLVEEAFLDTFGQQSGLAPTEVASWLRIHATVATPHSQRSEARVSVALPLGATKLGLLSLIERVEMAVATPLQTAVKRADEQAFAALNGQNLMFVEDAARRIKSALKDYARPDVHVRHLESLHPHDAVAWASPPHESRTGQ